MPSQKLRLIWSVTYEDIRYKMKMKISERMADFSQHFENFGIIVSRALGGAEDKPKPKAKPTQNWQQAQLACAELFS